MKFQFESNLEHQDKAIKSIIDIFSGIKTRNGMFTIERNQISLDNNYKIGISNIIQTNNWIRDIAQDNLHGIQTENGLPKSIIDNDFPTFDIEMETGTGKTYVFLKTILELSRTYNFKKFIIVVPSIAIKEGILKSLQITKEHFGDLYPDIKYNYCEYDGQSPQIVWNFSNSNNIEIMITNIQSINKETNVFNQSLDYLQGDKPIDLIRQTNPIVIIDEPQSTASGDKSINAIKSLNPLFILRYSATFRERKHENLVYKLDSFDAYNKKLVKEIHVFGVQVENNSVNSYIKLKDLDIKKQSAKIEIKVANERTGNANKTITVFSETDLYKKSNYLDEYKDLFITNLNFDESYLEISDGQKIYLNANDEQLDLKIKTQQISETIKTHLKKQLELKDKGIKVLSLFFIDKVAKYREKDENGKIVPGEYARIFESEFIKILNNNPKFKDLFSDNDLSNINKLASEVHDGYFSVDNKNNLKDTKGNTKDDKTTYDKIMKDKEKLISFNEKLSFIFSHSALKEGWDNPNVFQICTLNETKSDIKRRQEIGRGLRLCVNQDGERVYDEKVNILSVFTNDSYEDFIENLQKEMINEGIVFGVVEPFLFASIEELDKTISRKIFDLLINENVINSKGKLENKERNEIYNILSNSGLVKTEQIDSILQILENSTKKLNIKNGRNNKTNYFKKEVLESEDFKKLWDMISTKTIYNVSFDSKEYISSTIDNIIKNIEDIETTKLITEHAKVDMKRSGIEAKNAGTSSVKSINDSDINVKLIDIVSDIEFATKLTKKTIIEIISEKEIINALKQNQEIAKKLIIQQMNQQKQKLMVEGIEYIKTNDYYEQKLLEENYDFILDEEYTIDTKDSDKYPYQYIEIDKSNIEKQFGIDSLNSDVIKKFIKLPRKFVIKTPLGTYNPDWALYDDEQVIFVAETKGTTEKIQLRYSEDQKIECGKKHFEAVNKAIKYYQIDTLKNLLLKKSQKDNDE